MSDIRSDKEKQNILTEHEYDGIQEYDNQLPKWWLTTFFITMVFGFLYWTYFFIFYTGSPQEKQFQQEQEKHQALLDQNFQDLASVDFVKLGNDPKALELGKKYFQTYCSPCHGALGEGGIGPNITDNYWIHGNTPEQMAQVINLGVSEKGMTPWKGILSPTQINEIVVYIMSLEGSSPPNAKEPQGDLYEG